MGMYTGVRCKVIVNEEYREELGRLIENNLGWEDSNIVAFKDFSICNGANKFLYEDACYMTYCWHDEDGNPTDGFNRDFDINTGLWVFQCDLKNYNNEVGKFFDFVLSEMIDNIIHLEVLREEDEYSKSYIFNYGKITVNNLKFRYYPM